MQKTLGKNNAKNIKFEKLSLKSSITGKFNRKAYRENIK